MLLCALCSTKEFSDSEGDQGAVVGGTKAQQGVKPTQPLFTIKFLAVVQDILAQCKDVKSTVNAFSCSLTRHDDNHLSLICQSVENIVESAFESERKEQSAIQNKWLREQLEQMDMMKERENKCAKALTEALAAVEVD